MGPRDALARFDAGGGIHVVVWYLGDDQLLDACAKAPLSVFRPCRLPYGRAKHVAISLRGDFRIIGTILSMVTQNSNRVVGMANVKTQVGYGRLHGHPINSRSSASESRECRRISK